MSDRSKTKSQPDVIRDPRGRLVKGGDSLNPGGRPKGIAASQQYFMQTILDATTEQQAVAVWRVMQKKALEGDVQAARLVMEYTAARPMQQLNITSEPQTIVDVQWDYFPSLSDGSDGAIESDNGDGSTAA